MKCFRSVNGLYCKNPEYARLLPPQEKVQSHERKVPSSPRLRVFTGSQYERTPPQLRILAASQYERKARSENSRFTGSQYHFGGSCTETCVLVLPHERFRKKMAANFTITCYGGNG